METFIFTLPYVLMAGSITSMIILILYLWYLSYKKKNLNNTKETIFKIDLGNGPVIKTHSEIQSLTTDEKMYLFKNARHCTSFNQDIQNFDISKIKCWKQKRISRLDIHTNN